MSLESRVECAFFVPLRRDGEISDGELHTTDAWNWLSDELYDRFEARTIAPGLYEGLWKSPKTGLPIPDESRKYLVALPENRTDELRQLLREACGVFHQQAIYLSVAGHVEFIEAPTDGSTQ
jgi:hypothetical protein